MEDVSNQGRMIDELDKDEGAVLMSEKEEKKTEEVKDITGDAQVEGSETVNVAAVVPAAVTETVSTTAVVPIVTAALVKVAVPSTSEKEEWLSGIQRRNHWQRIILKPCPRTREKKAAKRRRRNEEVKDVEKLKRHLEIMPDEDDDVFSEATPLARKVPVVDYQIIRFRVTVEYSQGKILYIKSDDFLLTTLRAMFGRPDGQDQVWMNQRSVHGQARVKS
nr:hypothetical protein [Tanacetum cinerariifolium]